MRDGVFVNPLTIQPPPPEPLSAKLRPAFEEVRDRALARLAAVDSPTQIASR
jgi:hypothetical protein